MSKSEILFLASIAAVPLQLGKFFWPDFAFVLGIPIDYRAVSVYLADLVIIGYLIAFISENFKNFPSIINKNKTVYIIFGLLIIYVFANSIFRKEPQLPLFVSVKLLELILFSLFALKTFERKKVLRYFQFVIVFGVFWQVSLLLLQFIFQKSLGLTILGERTFDASTVGIAHMELLGRQLLRPYGTFPHPNVAAAFLTISLVFLWPRKTGVVMSFLGILLTTSKSALTSLSIYLTFSQNKLRNSLAIALSSFVIVVFLLGSISQSQISTISERLLLTQAAFDIAIKNPAFGVGSGNFIKEIANLNLFSQSEVRLLQPVHNIFLLILSENGTAGLLLFCILMLTTLKNANSKKKLGLFLSILVFASLDHFFWTLNQGKILFWLSLAFINSPTTDNS